MKNIKLCYCSTRCRMDAKRYVCKR